MAPLPTVSSSGNATLGLYVAHQNLSAILEISFDPELGPESSLSVIGSNEDAGVQPQWLTMHEDKIYSISRTGYPDGEGESGGLFAFQRPHDDEPSGTPLRLLSTESSHGEGGVHCDVSSHGKALAAANIEASTMAIYCLTEKGSIGEAEYQVKYHLDEPGPGNESQIEPFPHQAQFDPTGNFLFVCARGADRVHTYHVPDPGQVKPLDDIILPPGAGPRHLVFRVVGKIQTYMYLVGELDNTVRVYTISYSDTGSEISVKLHQVLSTLGPGLPPTLPKGENLAAEVVFTTDGKFAYVSNRGTTSLDSDTLAVYQVDDKAPPEHHLMYLDKVETHGKIPRHIALSPDAENRYIAVANEYSNDIAVFERNVESGLLKGLEGQLVLGEAVYESRHGPACVLWK